MLQKFRNNFAVKISLLFVLVQTLVLGGFGAYLYTRYATHQQEERVRVSSIPAKLINADVMPVSIVNDPTILETLIGLPVHWAYVVEEFGTVTYSTEPEWIGQSFDSSDLPAVAIPQTITPTFVLDQPDGCISVVSRLSPEVTGQNLILFMETDDAPIAARLQQIRQLAIVSMIITLAVYGFVLYFMVRRTFHRPIQALVGVLNRAEKGDLEVRSRESGNRDVVGQLQRSTNALLQTRQTSQGEIEHLNRVLRALRDVNQLITQQHDPVDLIEAISDHLVSSESYECAWIALLTPEGIVDRLHICSDSTDVRHADIDRPDTVACIKSIAHQQRDVVLLEAKQPDCGKCPCVQAGGCEQTMAVRLAYGETLYGVIAASVPESYHLDIQEQTLFQAVADDIAYGLYNIQNEAEQAETTRRLQESNQHIESLLNNPVGYVMFRLRLGETLLDSQTILVSPSVGEVAGVVPCEEDSIATWLRFILPEDKVALAKAFSRARYPPYRVDMELRYAHPVKGMRWLHIQASGVSENEGIRPQYANGILMDITERRLAEDQMRETVERLQQAEVAAQSGFWSQSVDDETEWWSDNHYHLHGLDPATYPTPSFGLHVGCIHPDDRKAFISQRQLNLASDRELIDEEFRLVLPNGDVRYIMSRAKILRDETGLPLRIMGMDQDVTERKLNEQRLAELLERVSQQAQLLQQVMNTVPDGIALLDYNNTLQLANPVALSILGDVSQVTSNDVLEDIAGTPLTDLLMPEKTGTWQEIGANNRVLEFQARPVRAEDVDRGWVLAIRDVTEARMARRYALQQERLASVGQLAAGIAHDFNNIMGVIILYAGALLMMEGLAESARERLHTIRDQARTATTLIQQILDFSRRSALERRPMDLVPFLKEQCRLFTRTLPENIMVDLNYDQASYVVNADPTSLQQVLMNLAVNARDAMPDGGALDIALTSDDEPSVQALSVSSSEIGTQQWVCISVKDTGSGMDEDILDHLFEPFHTTKEPGKGSGLGLAQVHGIIKQHGGEIVVDSEPGSGSRFRIYLPLLETSNVSDADSGQEGDLRHGEGETVLVVEDNPVMRQGLVETLKLLNYQSLEASNGHEALFVLSRHGDEVDLVLSDVVMPSMGGIELFDALQNQGLDVPMVLLTGHPLQGTIDGLLSRGLRAWMTKPPQLEALAEMIYTAIHN